MKKLMTLGLTLLMLAGYATQGFSTEAKKPIEVQNKDIVSDFFRLFSAGKIDAAFAMVSDDVV